MPILVDSHCHLNDAVFASQMDDVVVRARNAGVRRMITVGTSLGDMQAVQDIAAKYDDVFCSVGVHPQEASSPPEERALCEAAKNPKVVGIGETGFDFFYDGASHEEQEKNFRIHIRAAMDTGLPLIVHTRDAEEDTIRVLKEESRGAENKLKGVLHCFSSRRHLAEIAVEMGFYISLSGILTFKKSEELREIVADLPIDRLLVETDAPYLAPQSRRGKPCEPAYVVETAQVLAKVKNVPFDLIAQKTTENFFRLFSKVVPL